MLYSNTWVPISTTRPVGMWKYSVASVAFFERRMNSRSIQNGIPPFGEGFSERRLRKKEVDMISIRLALPVERRDLEQLQWRASLNNPGDRVALLANPDAIALPLEQDRERPGICC